MKSTNAAETQNKELRKALRLAIPLLTLHRDAWIESYATLPDGDLSTVKDKGILADVQRLNKAIKQAGLAVGSWRLDEGLRKPSRHSPKRTGHG
jgi:hypothetical protein